MVRRLSWLWILIGGLALFLILRRALVDTGNPSYLPSLILLGAAVVPASFVSFVFRREMSYDVTSGFLFLVALVGGVVGVVTAGILEYRTLVTLGVLPMVAVALIEEAAKLIGPAAILLLTVHQRHADGLLLGVAAGAGFAVLETMGYAFVTLIQTGGDLGAVQGVLLLRGLLSPAAHMAWTGLTAAALWEVSRRRSAWVSFVVIFVVAAGLHTAWDSVSSIPAYAVVAVISLALLLANVHRMHRLFVDQGEQNPAILPPLPGRP